jgi:hypothetical protein
MNKIKIRITKIARRTCGYYLSRCNCLLATALKRKGFEDVGALYQSVRINGWDYGFSIINARRIHHAYFKPKSAFKPFTVVLTPR